MLPRIVINSTTNHQTITLPFRKIPFLNKYIASETLNGNSGNSKKWMKVLHLDWMNKFSKDHLKWSAKRVVLEQFTYSVLVTFMFFVATSALDLLFDDFEKEQEEGKAFHQKFDNFPKELRERIENEFRDVHQNGMKYVPVANFINFLVVPPLYRGLYFNLVGVFWNVSQWAKEHYRIAMKSFNGDTIGEEADNSLLVADLKQPQDESNLKNED
ncbi:predicted protein [Naegleria gruberi]|uniref:Predicted protein n=1 Tax=Naegleria gruberi TaxID=5762 RepID=D2V8V2_NAEGR|nr:uncharacterized protein NAEGRDRAFT_65293 [Naegleria gruberi]EFC46863.1 predicted protein [Naegleria gruberi]|eukprot:XP_002679607.1 predicted protein [Naegleria gruberi strain NEG-M]